MLKKSIARLFLLAIILYGCSGVKTTLSGKTSTYAGGRIDLVSRSRMKTFNLKFMNAAGIKNQKYIEDGIRSEIARKSNMIHLDDNGVDLVFSIDAISSNEIDKSTADGISKYLSYNNSIMTSNDGKKGDFGINIIDKDDGISISSQDIRGIQAARKDTSIRSKVSSFLKRGEIIGGAVIGAVIAFAVSFPPAIIAAMAISGGIGTGLVGQLSSPKYYLTVLEVSVSEKISSNIAPKVKMKYKAVRKNQDGSVKEVYIDEGFDLEKSYIDHSTRFLIIDSARISTDRREARIANAIIKAVSSVA